MDESGDLGFSARSSRYFVVAYVIPENSRRLDKHIKHYLNRANEIYGLDMDEFKYSNDNSQVRNFFLENLKHEKFVAGFHAIDKEYVAPRLREIPDRLYNYLVVHPMLPAIFDRKENKVKIVLDRSKSKNSQEEFNSYFGDKLQFYSQNHNLPAPDYEIQHADSKKQRPIQVADYIAGSVRSKLQGKNEGNYICISDKILYKSSWGRFSF